jgi:hypothetical protein
MKSLLPAGGAIRGVGSFWVAEPERETYYLDRYPNRLRADLFRCLAKLS